MAPRFSKLPLIERPRLNPQKRYVAVSLAMLAFVALLGNRLGSWLLVTNSFSPSAKTVQEVLIAPIWEESYKLAVGVFAGLLILTTEDFLLPRRPEWRMALAMERAAVVFAFVGFLVVAIDIALVEIAGGGLVLPLVARVLDGTTPALAQGFTPTVEIVSSAKLLLAASNPLTTDLLVELQGATGVGGSPDGQVKTRVRLPANAIPTGPDFVTVDFSDYHVASPGERLQLVLRSSAPIPFGQYVQWFLLSSPPYSDYYLPGDAWSFPSGGPWSPLAGDLEFYVRGMDTTPVAEDQTQLASNAYQSLDTTTLWAQSFRPSHPILTGVDVVLYQTASFAGGVEVEVQASAGGVPSGVALARTFLHSGQLPFAPQPVSFPLPDLVVDTASNYFLVLRLTAVGSVRWQYHQALLDAQRDVYTPGKMAKNAGSWSTFLRDDFAFRTYGKAYARVVTAPYIQIAPDQLGGSRIWPNPPLSGEFYGPTATDDFTLLLNQYVQQYPPDEFGYVHVLFLFHSTSSGNLVVWAERLRLP